MTSRRIYPPVYFVLAIAAMVALDRWLPLVVWLTPPATHAGWLFIVAGVALAVIAKRQFDKAGTTVMPFRPSSAVVDAGPFSFNRNPMYSGLMLCLVGVFVLLGSLSPIALIPLLFWILHTRFVLREEAFLEQQFGDAYLAYKRRVRRWI